MSTIDDQAASWMVRRLGRELTVPERQEFETWYEADIRHKGAYLRAVAIHHTLNRATVQHDLRPQALPGGPAAARARRAWPWPMLGGIAAAVLVALAVAIAPGGATVDLVTAKGETRRYTLPDSSVASLNSDSAVEVTVKDDARRVQLVRGEAFFQVAKDARKPFIVSAGEVRARAVGTAFSVRRYGNGAEVLVTEGVVEVWHGSGAGRHVLLARGEHAFMSGPSQAASVGRQDGEVERRLAWRKGKIVFTNQTLAEAVADFNRHSARRIIIVDPAITRVVFIGQYALDAPEVFAKDVSTYLDVPLEITDEAIRIGKPGAAARRPARNEGEKNGRTAPGT